MGYSYAKVQNLTLTDPKAGAQNFDISGSSTLTSNPYNNTLYKYPMEIGSIDVPSYVIFDIYAPKNVQIKNASTINPNQGARINTDVDSSPGLQALQTGNKNVGTPIGALSSSGQVNTVTNGTVGFLTGLLKQGWATWSAGGSFGSSLGDGLAAGVGGAVGGTATALYLNSILNLNPAYQRVDTSIAIYMPDTLMFSTRHNHRDFSVTQNLLGQAGYNTALGDAGFKALTSFFNGDHNVAAAIKNNPTLMEGASMALGAMGAAGPELAAASLKGVGLAINPQTELLYSGTSNREFEFEFIFHPRSQAEAEVIKNIIKSFKANAAPALNPAATGRYFIVPNLFDIKFIFKGNENQYINKISSCVLQQIEVNYAAGGEFVPMSDGSPSATGLKLLFKEATIMYRDLIMNQGY